MIVQITTATGDIEIEVIQIVFKPFCKHCGEQFETKEPDKEYCRPSHYVRASEYRRIIRESRTVSTPLRSTN